MLGEDGRVEEKWIELLGNIKQQGNLQRMAVDLEKYDEAKKPFDPYYIFLYYNNDGSVGLQIIMRFNNLSGVWKIQSL